MIRRLSFALIALFFTVSFLSCKKNDLLGDRGQTIVKGNIRLQVTTQHHSWVVPYLDIYLKRNADTFPGDDVSLYEYQTSGNGNGVAVFKELYPGNYYVYARGYDSYFGASVSGALKVELKAAELTNNSREVVMIVGE